MRIHHAIAAGAFALALAGCQQRSGDGLSEAGKISPVTEWPTDRLDASKLTDAVAVVDALKQIETGAPPLDHSDPASLKKREAYDDAAKAKIFGKSDVLIALKCAPVDDKQATLSFDPTDKNLVVRLYGDLNGAREHADTMRDALSKVVDRQYDADQAAILNNGMAFVHPILSFRDDYKELIDRISEDGFRAAIIRTASGPDIDVQNSPLRYLGSDIKHDLSLASLASAKFNLALSEERNSPIGEAQKLLRPTQQKWRFFPLNMVPEKQWRASIPFAGEPKNVCLIGRFSEIDTAYSKYTKGLVANQNGWYIIDRTTLKIIAAQRIPVTN